LQPVTEGDKRGEGTGKRRAKIIKNKVCKIKKGFYLCSPKRKGQKTKRAGSDFRGIKLKVKMVKAIQNI
jgi:hypothetical protein